MCNWKDSSEALFQWVSAHLHFTWFQVGTLTELFTKQGNKIPEPPLLVSWASRESLCNWQCLLEQWSNTKKQPETTDLTFLKVRAEHKRDGMVLKFHSCTALTIPTWIVPMFYLEVQVQEQTSWGRSRPSKLLTPKTCHKQQWRQRVAECSMPWKWWCVTRLWLWWRKPCRESQESQVIQVHHETLSDLTHWVSWFNPCLQVFQSSSYQ